MDNPTAPTKILTKRNIFILLSVVILAEVLWAGWSLFKPTPQTSAPPPQVIPPKPTVVALETPKREVKVGDKFTVSIKISSDKLSDGSDLIISFDPKLLTVETVGTEKAPVIVGTLYNDYPLNKLNSTLGKITVSGVVTQKDGVKADGLFGSIVFTAKAAGVTQVSFDFSPGKTSDSNVTETGTGKDVLEKVENLEVNISP